MAAPGEPRCKMSGMFEVNHAPSFATESELDHQVKNEALRESLVSIGDCYLLLPAPACLAGWCWLVLAAAGCCCCWLLRVTAACCCLPDTIFETHPKQESAT